jgi:hypothetical protein
MEAHAGVCVRLGVFGCVCVCGLDVCVCVGGCIGGDRWGFKEGVGLGGGQERGGRQGREGRREEERGRE